MTNRFLEKGPLTDAKEPVDLIEIISEDNDKQKDDLLAAYIDELIRYKNKIKSVFFIDTRYLQRHYDRQYNTKWKDEEPQVTLLKQLKNAGISYKVYTWEEFCKYSLEEGQKKSEDEKIHCIRVGYDYKKAEEEIDRLIKANAHHLENKLTNLSKQYAGKKDLISAEKVAKEEAVITLMLKGVISCPDKTLDTVKLCLINKGINPDLKFHGRRAELLVKEKKLLEDGDNAEVISSLPKDSPFTLATVCTAAVNQIAKKSGRQLNDQELFQVQYLLGNLFIKANTKGDLKISSYSKTFFPPVADSNSKFFLFNVSESDTDNQEENLSHKQTKSWCNIL